MRHPLLPLAGALLFCGLIAPAAHAASPAEAAAACLAADASADADGDGLTDRYERCTSFTDPALADTDGDGSADKAELDAGLSPRETGKRLIEVDSDKDYLNDDWELKLGTGLMDPDSDGDLYLDGTEVAAGFDPRTRGPSRLEKRIDVSDKDLTLTYSMGGVTLGKLPVSTGKSSTPTPRGEFSISAKVPEKWYKGPTWNYPHTKWNLLFTRRNGLGYYVHSAYWHDKFGTARVSGGCVNVRVADMEQLYWWAQVGTKMVVS